MSTHPLATDRHLSPMTTTLPTRPLGQTGLEVSCVGLGEMPLSIDGRPPEAEAIRVIHTALEAGMTLIDTADVYCRDHRDIGHGERLVAKALASWSGPKGRVLVATKGGCERPGGQWTVNGRPKHLVTAVEASLKALDVEVIGLYQLHAVDSQVPLAESLGTLARLQTEGKIRHLGVSNVNVWELEEALRITPIVSVQNRCNPFERASLHSGVVAACERHGLTFLAHSPVGGHRGHLRTPADPTLASVGANHEASAHQVCLAWLLALSPCIVPIPGASRETSVLSSAAAAGLHLTAAEMDLLAAAFPR